MKEIMNRKKIILLNLKKKITILNKVVHSKKT